MIEEITKSKIGETQTMNITQKINGLMLSVGLVAGAPILNGATGTLAFLEDNNGLITQDITLTVAASGEDYTSIEDALITLSGKVFAPGVVATISVKNGTYDGASDTGISGIILDHPQGNQIEIMGESETGCVLVFADDEIGFSVLDGYSFGKISRMTIKGYLSGGKYGVYAFNGGTITLGGDVTLEGFDRGLYANMNSTVRCEDGLAVKSMNNEGVWADGGSFIACNGASTKIETCGTYGLRSTNGSMLSAISATVENNGPNAEVLAESGSTINLSSATVDGNSSVTNAIWATTHSYIRISSGNIKNSSTRDILADNGSFVTATSVVIDDGLNPLISLPAVNTVGNNNSYVRN